MTATALACVLLLAIGAGGSSAAAHTGPVGVTAGDVTLTLDGASLTWSQIRDVLVADTVDVRLSVKARRAMSTTRQGALEALRGGGSSYGWNRGLGPLKDQRLSPAQQREFSPCS